MTEMANQPGRQDDDRGTKGTGGAAGQVADTEFRQGNRGQPATGDKDARGLTRDKTLLREEKEAPVPGDAARGPWAVDTTPKGD
jgi:hypothetical protein